MLLLDCCELMDRCGSLWARCGVVVDRGVVVGLVVGHCGVVVGVVVGCCGVVVGRCGVVVGSLWGRCGSLWVVPCFSNYDRTCDLWNTSPMLWFNNISDTVHACTYQYITLIYFLFFQFERSHMKQLP